MEANVQGVGYNSVLDLIRPDSSSLCSTLTIVSNGLVLCRTIEADISTAEAISTDYNGATIPCGNSDTSNCEYSTPASGSPTVTSIQTIPSDLITITGTDFPTSGYTAKVYVGGFEADSVVVEDSTTIKASYDLGIA